MTPQRQQALARIATAAADCERDTGTPAELLVAQCVVESNWLESMAGQNNVFGYKWYPGAFGRQLLQTRERFNETELAAFLAMGEGRTAVIEDSNLHDGRMGYRVMDYFATFPSLEACFAKRAQRFNAGRGLPWVKAYFQNDDIEELFRNVAVSYSTERAGIYAQALMAVIRMPEVVAALADARLKAKTVNV